MSVDKNMSILIVDDYKTMLKIVRNLLSQLGFNNVEEATDGTMALEKLNSPETNFSLVYWSSLQNNRKHHKRKNDSNKTSNQPGRYSNQSLF